MRGLQQQRVHERLRQVPAQLMLPDVVFLGEQPGWTARGPIGLE